MDPIQDVSAESSSAQTLPLESLTDAQRSDWLRTGDLPKAEASASSTTTKKTTDAGDKPAEAAAASEAAESRENKPGGKKQDANARIRELLAENKRLKEAQGKPAEGKPAAEAKPAEAAKPADTKTETPSAGTSTRPQKPVFEKFDSVGEYEAAVDKYHEDLADWKYEQREQKRVEEQKEREAKNREAEVHSKFLERIESSKKAHADYDEIIESAEHLEISPAIQAFVMGSEIAGELSYHLASNHAEIERIAKLDPVDAFRELAKLEVKLSSAAAAPAAAAATPPKPKTTSASKPPTELSGRAAAPEDEADAALKAGNFAAYHRIMNARDAQRTRK